MGKEPGVRAAQLAEAKLTEEALSFVLAFMSTKSSSQCAHKLLAPQVHEVPLPKVSGKSKLSSPGTKTGSILTLVLLHGLFIH